MKPQNLLETVVWFALRHRLVVVILTALLVLGGLVVSPFGPTRGLPWDPVPVDAIPNLGENQQIVFTAWSGRSPSNVEDQVTYPLTSALLGLPGVQSIRSTSSFGFSSIYVIFEDGIDFYWSRSRLLEKLAALPPGTLPEGVVPTLGPDATGLGQVFWYTLEGRDPASGAPTAGWDLEERRSWQDWTVRRALQSVPGVAEVSSIGGFVREYQVDLDPAVLRAWGISVEDVFAAVRSSNQDTGARTLEFNRVEYVIRGLGFLRSVEDLEQTVVTERDRVPVMLSQVAQIGLGPAPREGLLDRDGAETVGGVVVVRHGANPQQVIAALKARLAELAPSLPSRTLAGGTVSQLTVVPFYDRSGLIQETLGTLREAVFQQILITIVVVVLLVLHLRSSLLIGSMLPLAVLFAFLGMKVLGLEANLVSLAGIAIAIGTVVDLGIVLCESVLARLERAPPEETRLETIFEAAREVGPAMVTAVATTVVSFLPVFFLTGAEGKLFAPLAWTKTLALVGSLIVALGLLPAVAHLLLRRPRPPADPAAAAMPRARWRLFGPLVVNALVAVVATVVLAHAWAPLGPAAGLRNLFFVVLVVGGVLLSFALLVRFYVPILRALLAGRGLFLGVVAVIILLGAAAWLGWPKLTAWAPAALQQSSLSQALARTFPGLGREFMPPLDEGSFLYMPTTLPHASIGEVAEVMSMQNRALAAIPELTSVVGKAGRADSALDPAPVEMIETILLYAPEFATDADGHRLTFAVHADGTFQRDADGALITDDNGEPYRNWRPEIRSPADIWHEITAAAELPGTTSAPRLQPIAARQVMLQSGLRSALGLKVFGPSLEVLEEASRTLEAALKQIPQLRPETVFADRVIGKPYLEIVIDRPAAARLGLSIAAIQQTIDLAIGGMPLTTTVEGPARRDVRVRFARELRDTPEALADLLLTAPNGQTVPLREVAKLEYTRGPQMIRGEDTFLANYVIFDRQPGIPEVEAVLAARAALAQAQAEGRLELPPGVTWRFAGTYENQVRAEARLAILLPICLALIWVLVSLQFNRLSLTAIVFSGVLLAWSGGFLLLWLQNQPGFLDFSLFGQNLREVFRLGPVNLSVAVWVGFLALFGIATDDGVLMGTYLRDRFRDFTPNSVAELREAVVEAASRRIRPAAMTSATTLLALLPVLTSTGRGADLLRPMALPACGGMLVAFLTVFVTPILFAWVEERRLAKAR